MKKPIQGARTGLFLLMAVAVLLIPFTGKAAGKTEEFGDYVATVYNEQNGLPTGEANVVIQTSDGYIWIGSYGGLIRYDGTNFVNYSTEKNGISSSSVRSLFEDSEGRLFIGTNDAGVFLYQNNEFIKIQGPENHSFLCIRDFAEGKDGVVYAASNSGLAKIEDGALIPVAEKTLGGNLVYSLAVDSFARIWCCLSGGICSVVDQDEVVGQISSDLFFSEEEIYCIASDGDGRIYLGTDGSRMARLTLKDDGFEKTSFEAVYSKTEGVVTHNQIRVCDGGQVLISGLKGVGCLNGQGKYVHMGEQHHAASVNAAELDYEGNLWLASSALGIVKYSKGCFETPNEQAGLAGISLNTVIKLGDQYYAGTNEGLLAFDQNWNPVENALTDFLSKDRVRNMIVTKDGLLWVASYYGHGVVCYDADEEKIHCFTTEEGLTNDGVRVLLELSDGSVAVGTQDGISIIKDGKVIDNYKREDGKGLGNGTILCLAEGEDGVLYAGSDGGGIYAISGGEITCYGFEHGLDEGVVLRMLRDTEGDGWFVSAGSSLYYFENGSCRKLTNFKKSAGSIFDLYEKDGTLFMMQNNGILTADRDGLVDGKEVETALYGVSYGLSGTLNANTWNYLDEDGTLYLSTRSGVSMYRFTASENILPWAVINDIQVDDCLYMNPKRVNISKEETRITIDFATLSYTGTTRSKMAYQLLGFDEKETVISDAKSSSISYTNLPGGDYTFILRVYDSDDPQVDYQYTVPIHKEKKITEYFTFWLFVVICSLFLVAVISYLIARAKISQVKKRQKEYQNIVVQFLMAFARMIDAKDPYTNGHSVRVAWYSQELAGRMNLSEKDRERVYYIALMHDIGKIGIPDSILKKAGRLTDEEMAVIRTHPAIGGEILKDCTALKGIAEGAKYHHERYDGTGYCMGLAGKEIPQIARIIGVADAYDAMSNARCYRKALPKEVIIHELKEGAGTQFDPEIVPLMLQMIEEGVVPVDIEGNSLSEKPSE